MNETSPARFDTVRHERMSKLFDTDERRAAMAENLAAIRKRRRPVSPECPVYLADGNQGSCTGKNSPDPGLPPPDTDRAF